MPKSKPRPLIAADLGCIDQATATRIIDGTDYIGRMITNLMRHMPPPE